jgi:Flagellar hook-length control protein FliK
MIGRDPILKSELSSAASPQKSRNKLPLPDIKDAGHFLQLAQGHSYKPAGLGDCEDPEDVRPAKAVRAEKNEPIELNREFFSPLVLIDLTVKIKAQPGAFEPFMVGHNSDMNSGVELPLIQKPLRKHVELQLQFLKEIEPKTVGLSAHPRPQFRELDTAKNAELERKVKTELPQIVVPEPNKEAAKLAVPAVLVLMNSNVEQTQSSRISDLPHITRLHIESVKRNATGVLSSLELVLEPVELGRITAKLQHEDGKVTLILSAEHQHVADDLTRDGALLLRALGDQIPNIERMSVQIRAETSQGSETSFQNGLDLQSGGRDKNPHDAKPDHRNYRLDEMPGAAAASPQNTTHSKILI